MYLIQRHKDSLDPFDLLRGFQTDLDQFFTSPAAASKSKTTQQLIDPDIEITEKGDAYVVHADLPGMKKEDFEVTVEGNRFILRGERKEETKEDRKGYHYSERRYGSFTRGFHLPTEIDAAKVVAGYKNGVLEVTLPKIIKEKTKKIEVKVD